MIKGNNKGFSLIEILITIALIAIVVPIITAVFLYGLQDYMTGTRYMEQQAMVNGTYMTLRQEYEKASNVTFVSDNSTGAALNQLASITLEYDPNNAVIDYDQSYKDYGIGEGFYWDYSIETKPPFTPGKVTEINEEAFAKTYFFEKDSATNTCSLSVSSGGIVEPILPNLYTEFDGNNTGIFYLESEKKIWIRLLPKPVNNTLFRSRNITRPVLWYFDYVYKNIEYLN